ncbi:small ribosomal subunit protein uS17c-like [Bidens hawaiensis]|uniref:small ribosomal subunit protein uS17c-like n=1 Tax=Bidens hawaiensis TaxID=980011 RepID=UPI0040494F61
MRSLQGRVICTTNDKTVNVEVVRLAPHPKYKRRVRKKKKFQAHDPDNQFEVGDIVQLEKCKPISKKKTFLAVPVPKRPVSKKPSDVGSIPLESEQMFEKSNIWLSGFDSNYVRLEAFFCSYDAAL